MSQDESRNEDPYVREVLSAMVNQAPDEDLSTLLKRRRTELELAERQAANVLGMTQGAYRSLENGDTKAINQLTLHKLKHFLELDMDHLVRVAASRMTTNDGAEIDRMREFYFLAKNFDVRGLKKIGFIRSISDWANIRDRLVEFFELNSIFEYDARVATALFSKHRRTPREKMRDFWVRSAFAQFERRSNPNDFNEERLAELVPHIHQYTRYEKSGLLTVAQALYGAGVTVIAQDHLPGTQVRGATFLVSGKPCIVLSDLKKDYSTVWFSLMHEIGHVLLHRDALEDDRYHLSGDDDLYLIEPEANRFARKLLFANEKIDYIEPFIDNPQLVVQYAKKENVHPAIIYGFYAYRLYETEGDKSGFIRFGKYIPKPEDAIRALRCYPWEKENITADIDDVINNLESV